MNSKLLERPRISAISYSQFSERLNKQVIAKKIPIDGSFELTLRCAHCYGNLSLNNRDAISKEIKTREIFSIFDQVAEAGPVLRS